MIYDYAIIGAGVAGTVCAYLLARQGKICIILEKNYAPAEKICGGGVSYKALQMLRTIGIQIEPLFEYNSKLIVGHSIKKADGNPDIKKYDKGKISLGIQRILFDSYLLSCALNEGVAISYGHTVRNVVHTNGFYKIGNYFTKYIVWAVGARGIQKTAIAGQSIGYSGQVYARSKIASDLFHYWYYEKGNDSKYFWSFPIAENLWNVGLWSRHPFQKMKSEYFNCLENLFLTTVEGEWNYYKMPKAEFLGHTDQRKNHTFLKYGVGDFAGKCNPLNGGGIIGAIASSIQFAQMQSLKLASNIFRTV